MRAAPAARFPQETGAEGWEWTRAEQPKRGAAHLRALLVHKESQVVEDLVHLAHGLLHGGYACLALRYCLGAQGDGRFELVLLLLLQLVRRADV